MIPKVGFSRLLIDGRVASVWENGITEATIWLIRVPFCRTVWETVRVPDSVTEVEPNWTAEAICTSRKTCPEGVEEVAGVWALSV